METLNHGILRFNDECTLKIDFDQETDDMTVTRFNDVTGEETVITGGGQSGGGDEWQLLEDYTLESEGLLQVAVTNISVKQIKVIMIQPKSYSSTAIVYVPINNPDGNHWDYGYGRAYQQLANSSATDERVYTIWNEPYIIDEIFIWWAEGMNINSLERPSRGVYMPHAKAVAGQEITSVSVATYASIPAGLRVLVFGK